MSPPKAISSRAAEVDLEANTTVPVRHLNQGQVGVERPEMDADEMDGSRCLRWSGRSAVRETGLTHGYNRYRYHLMVIYGLDKPPCRLTNAIGS